MPTEHDDNGTARHGFGQSIEHRMPSAEVRRCWQSIIRSTRAHTPRPFCKVTICLLIFARQEIAKKLRANISRMAYVLYSEKEKALFGRAASRHASSISLLPFSFTLREEAPNAEERAMLELSRWNGLPPAPITHGHLPRRDERRASSFQQQARGRPYRQETAHRHGITARRRYHWGRRDRKTAGRFCGFADYRKKYFTRRDTAAISSQKYFARHDDAAAQQGQAMPKCDIDTILFHFCLPSLRHTPRARPHARRCARGIFCRVIADARRPRRAGFRRGWAVTCIDACRRSARSR